MSVFNLFKKSAPPQSPPPEVVLPLEAPEATIDSIAASMSPQQAVWWACKSTEKVTGQTTPQDLQAAKAAESWVKQPSEQTKLSALEAAKKAAVPGPGVLAAQATGLKQSALATTAAGAVKLAAALQASPEKVQAITASIPSVAPKLPTLQQIASMPPVPKVSAQDLWRQMPKIEAQKTLQALQPFIDLGKAIQQGQNTWA